MTCTAGGGAVYYGQSWRTTDTCVPLQYCTEFYIIANCPLATHVLSAKTNTDVASGFSILAKLRRLKCVR